VRGCCCCIPAAIISPDLHLQSTHLKVAGGRRGGDWKTQRILAAAASGSCSALSLKNQKTSEKRGRTHARMHYFEPFFGYFDQPKPFCWPRRGNSDKHAASKIRWNRNLGQSQGERQPRLHPLLRREKCWRTRMSCRRCIVRKFVSNRNGGQESCGHCGRRAHR
jgi:hypothetical protein